jgi:hypothetical protein
VKHGTTRAWLGALAIFGILAAGATQAQARITRIEITDVQSPTFDGAVFGSTGQYEKLVGKVFGEVDPADPLDAGITDIRLAPRNARGAVEYSGTIMIIRPRDAARGNHRLLMEVNNRGKILLFSLLNDAKANSDDPKTAADAGNGFMMRQGFTIAEVAWDAISGATPGVGGGPFVLTVPVAKQADGTDIVGPSMEEFVVDAAATTTGPLTYPAASLDPSRATLTARAQVSDKPEIIPSTQWHYNEDGTAISLLPEGTKFKEGMLYEFVYPAKDPKITGLGFAAVRDTATFLRDAKVDSQGHANPLAGDIEREYTACISQPCRFMRDFVALGFNETDDPAASPGGPIVHRPVFDGVLNWVGGGSGLYLNYRFAEPYRTHRQHIARWYPEFAFPFAYPTTTDGVTGKTDGLLRRCAETSTCPKIIDANSENEYWAKDGAILHTDTQGNDLPDAPGVRIFLVSGRPHGDGVPASGPGICQVERNPLVGNAAMRALLVALDAWVSTGREPPPSRVPRHADGTLVGPAQQEVGFPHIPGITYNARLHTGDLFDFGPQADQGITATLPPVLLGSPYPVAVPRTDADGNDVAGIRLPDIAVPVATYTGWNLRKTPAQEGCDAAGMVIPFARTKAERLANGDPRLSLEERYPDHGSYVRAVTQSANALRDQGLLLGEDVDRYVTAADASDIGK